MKDGDIDYSGYTVSELHQALDGIGRNAYPRNYTNLLAALKALESAAEGTTNVPIMTSPSQALVPGYIMAPALQRYYIAAIYLVVGILLLINCISLANGVVLALIPVALQAFVLVAVYLRTSWAYITVVVWSAIAIIAGAAMWVAVFLRGGELTQSAFQMTFKTGMLFIALFFAIFARDALRSTHPPT